MQVSELCVHGNFLVYVPLPFHNDFLLDHPKLMSNSTHFPMVSSVSKLSRYPVVKYSTMVSVCQG